MSKDILQKGDLLVFKNNHKAFLDESKFRIIQEYYDDDLNCISDDNYTIIQVFRPEYQLVFEREKGKEHGIKR